MKVVFTIPEDLLTAGQYVPECCKADKELGEVARALDICKLLEIKEPACDR